MPMSPIADDDREGRFPGGAYKRLPASYSTARANAALLHAPLAWGTAFALNEDMSTTDFQGGRSNTYAFLVATTVVATVVAPVLSSVLPVVDSGLLVRHITFRSSS